jgi:hypothetical protein
MRHFQHRVWWWQGGAGFAVKRNNGLNCIDTTAGGQIKQRSVQLSLHLQIPRIPVILAIDKWITIIPMLPNAECANLPRANGTWRMPGEPEPGHGDPLRHSSPLS